MYSDAKLRDKIGGGFTKFSQTLIFHFCDAKDTIELKQRSEFDHHLVFMERKNAIIEVFYVCDSCWKIFYYNLKFKVKTFPF